MRQLVSLVLAVGMAATACSSSSDSESSASAESPLADFLGVDMGFDGSDDQQAEMEEQQRQIDEQVTACMSAEGFEWLPDPNQTIFFSGEDVDGLEWGSSEWVAKYGFGISTERFSQTAVGPDLVGWDDSQMMGGEDYVDPNQEYLGTLSPAEQDAFYSALYGGPGDNGPEWDDTLSEEENNEIMNDYFQNDYVPTGCMNVAQEEVFNDSSWAVFDQFGDELEDMYNRMEADPRIVEANAKVSSCVSDKGLTFTTMNDVYETFEDRLGPVDDAQQAAYMNMDDPFEGMTDDELSAMTEEDFMAFDVGEPPLPDDARDLLGEIQRDEIDLAVAVDECGGGWQAQEALYNEVRVEYEQEFIDTNREALEAAKSGN